MIQLWYNFRTSMGRKFPNITQNYSERVKVPVRSKNVSFGNILLTKHMGVWHNGVLCFCLFEMYLMTFDLECDPEFDLW